MHFGIPEESGLPNSVSEYGMEYLTWRKIARIGEENELRLECELEKDIATLGAEKIIWRIKPEFNYSKDRVCLYARFHVLPPKANRKLKAMSIPEGAHAPSLQENEGN